MLALLFHLTLAATFAVQPAVADHFVCSYKPGGGSPVQYGYHEYCHAGIIDHINSTDVAIYGCDPGFIGGLNTKVAEWWSPHRQLPLAQMVLDTAGTSTRTATAHSGPHALAIPVLATATIGRPSMTANGRTR
ncbi:hypothetical protein BDZ90DRAFT_233102 [Jaminaea rosea]|uniref:Uncharacterized protein n=1 Tax=Jaminaea rosea TaxID=1569628 RepID=A0A316URG3_9BASI|nr:hypothetical protein BDZ90DRAFT_233102 [Jaminaea rosea]PWN26463.1 hypothetical protein BDZ90DRAFT_233102 [Jaminaea rosea]